MTPGKTRTHLVWDWNGTLLDDIHAVIHATNAAFAEVELAPLTLEQYREMYCVPIPHFYERLLGRLPTEAEWERMDDIFHRYYAERRVACGLTAGAEDLLARWKLAGHSQSLLSMYGHEHLVPVVRGYGIEAHFVRVDGRTGPSGGSKALHMERHFEALARGRDISGELGGHRGRGGRRGGGGACGGAGGAVHRGVAQPEQSAGGGGAGGGQPGGGGGVGGDVLGLTA